MNTALSVQAGTVPPQSLPRALPPWVYRHPEMTRLEFERILKPSWQRMLTRAIQKFFERLHASIFFFMTSG